ncbi:MAG: quinone-dependent dihydroorotate dehydrogenase, partial [Candidatus Levybacteria bacterium]|nr:quinone-dependent dihydroorotate dehydrogenase [Candidatus Levybacteria bacterium]
KNIFFQFDPELIHDLIVKIGETQGKISFVKKILKSRLSRDSSQLKQKIAGIEFRNPIGLAAGFDYNGELTQILPALDFGFQTVGTITNHPYEGNPKPRLGRLPKSRSLMVNKGFKNKGAAWIARKLAGQTFEIPLGISIGKTNIKQRETQKSAIEDILSSFCTFEDSNIKSSYYELNVSCPNLFGNISFYPPKNLSELLTEVDKLKLKKPVFIKMPINETDKQIEDMLDIIVRHKIAGVIFGNLQKDRKDSSLDSSEVAKWKMGNFSGLPTKKRSNELISFAYKKYGNKLVIIGCGGIFNTGDAYQKIKLGASLLQLITGLIYEGPLLVAKINSELPKLLKKDGFKYISEAIGTDIL